MSQAATTQTRLSSADRDALEAARWSALRDPAYLQAAQAARDVALSAPRDALFAVSGPEVARAEAARDVAFFAAQAADLAAFAAGLPAGLLRDRAEAAAKKARATHTRKATTLAKRTA
jgi:hypothetical protein